METAPCQCEMQVERLTVIEIAVAASHSKLGHCRPYRTKCLTIAANVSVVELCPGHVKRRSSPVVPTTITFTNLTAIDIAITSPRSEPYTSIDP